MADIKQKLSMEISASLNQKEINGQLQVLKKQLTSVQMGDLESSEFEKGLKYFIDNVNQAVEGLNVAFEAFEQKVFPKPLVVLIEKLKIFFH